MNRSHALVVLLALLPLVAMSHSPTRATATVVVVLVDDCKCDPDLVLRTGAHGSCGTVVVSPDTAGEIDGDCNDVHECEQVSLCQNSEDGTATVSWTSGGTQNCADCSPDTAIDVYLNGTKKGGVAVDGSSTLLLQSLGGDSTACIEEGKEEALSNGDKIEFWCSGDDPENDPPRGQLYVIDRCGKCGGEDPQ